jgi:hypothetical protein
VSLEGDRQLLCKNGTYSATMKNKGAEKERNRKRRGEEIRKIRIK